MSRTPGQYERMGNCIYILEITDRIYKGMEQFQNRIYANFQGGPDTPKEEVEATAAFFQMAANTHDTLVAALELTLKRCGSCGGSGIAYTMDDETEISQPLGSSAIDCPECYDIRAALALVKSQEAPDEKA